MNYNLADVKNLIPLRAIDSQDFHYNNYTKDNLQKAFDTFHQEDYETAILIFKKIVEVNFEMKEVYLYLGISYYCFKDYENASQFISYYGDNKYGINRDLISGLLDFCSVITNDRTTLIFRQKSLFNCTGDCKITA